MVFGKSGEFEKSENKTKISRLELQSWFDDPYITDLHPIDDESRQEVISQLFGDLQITGIEQKHSSGDKPAANGAGIYEHPKSIVEITEPTPPKPGVDTANQTQRVSDKPAPREPDPPEQGPKHSSKKQERLLNALEHNIDRLIESLTRKI